MRRHVVMVVEIGGNDGRIGAPAKSNDVTLFSAPLLFSNTAKSAAVSARGVFDQSASLTCDILLRP